MSQTYLNTFIPVSEEGGGKKRMVRMYLFWLYPRHCSFPLKDIIHEMVDAAAVHESRDCLQYPIYSSASSVVPTFLFLGPSRFLTDPTLPGWMDGWMDI